MRKLVACILVVAVLMTCMASVAFAGPQAFNFNLRAVSNGLTGFSGTKGDDEQRYYVTINSVIPETDGAQWTSARFYSVWKSTGDVASDSLMLYPSSLSGSAGYTDDVGAGDSFKLNIKITTPTDYSNVYFLFTGRWNP